MPTTPTTFALHLRTDLRTLPTLPSALVEQIQQLTGLADARPVDDPAFVAHVLDLWQQVDTFIDPFFRAFNPARLRIAVRRRPRNTRVQMVQAKRKRLRLPQNGMIHGWSRKDSYAFVAYLNDVHERRPRIIIARRTQRRREQEIKRLYRAYLPWQ